MKTTALIPTLAALLLAAALSPAHAASLITDGDFDSLPVGTAPDNGKAAGHWAIMTGSDWPEIAPADFTIAKAPGEAGNALQLSYSEIGQDIAEGVENTLTRRVTQASGERIVVTFDVFVVPGFGGAAFILGNNTHEVSLDGRATQLTFSPSGLLASRSKTGLDLTLSDSYPRGVWQSIRSDVDISRQRFDFYLSERGQPVTVTKKDLPFRGSSVSFVDRVVVVRFRDFPGSFRASWDNFRVTTDPAIAPVTADLAAGGATTLQVVNLPVGDAAFQWQRNGQDIAGATAATLDLSNVTSEQAGNYTVTVTRAGQSVTTEASTVRVFNQLTITTPPETIEAVSGKTTGFSVAAVGPLPMTYQWRFNGVDMPDKTNRFLTFPATVDAAGDYSVVVSDGNGSVVSGPAKLSVLVRPSFVQPPLAMRVVAGGSVTFSAAVTGTGPFTYQWRKGSAFDGSVIRSTVKTVETSAFFALNNVQAAQGGTYRLYLGNPAVPEIAGTSPNRSFTLTVLPDTDGDGLPDEWETANGLNPADASDAAQDKDGDGIDNLAEYRAGTNPTDVASAFKAQAQPQANGQMGVSFAAAANQTYTVEVSGGLNGGSWEKLADVVAESADHTETVIDPRGGEAARFYRVVTPRRP